MLVSGGRRVPPPTGSPRDASLSACKRKGGSGRSGRPTGDAPQLHPRCAAVGPSHELFLRSRASVCTAEPQLVCQRTTTAKSMLLAARAVTASARGAYQVLSAAPFATICSMQCASSPDDCGFFFFPVLFSPPYTVTLPTSSEYASGSCSSAQRNTIDPDIDVSH